MSRAPRRAHDAGMTSPNILLIMTDEERYPPPYETAEVAEFRRTQMPARERVRDGGLELHRHYAGSVACVPSRATLFTGQYPSLHGVAKTSGIAKRASDPAMGWLDPDEVPTMGDWFRAGGYQTHYRGKWHVSHADLEIPGSHESVMASDDDGRPIAEAVEAYRKADRLNPFGFSGWIGREAHGASKSDCGTVRDGVFAEQVIELFDDLVQASSDGPWLAVASFVNPHDIAFAGGLYKLLFDFEPCDDTVPEIPEPPSQGDSFAGPARVPGAVQDGVATDGCRPACRPGVPPALLLPPQGRRPGDRADPRRAGGVGHGRRHHRRVHLRPRRSARRPRRVAAEVVQRVRRSDPRPVRRARPWGRTRPPRASRHRPVTST